MEKIEKVDDNMPLNPPEDILDKLLRRGFLKSDVLIYKVGYVKMPLSFEKTKMVHVHCTACGGECYVDYVPASNCSNSYSPAPFGFMTDEGVSVISGDSCLCPCCKKGVKAVHIGRFKDYYPVEYKSFITVQNVAGELAVLMWDGFKKCDKKGNVEFSFCRNQAVVFADGKLYRYAGGQKNMGSGFTYFNRWERRQRFDDKIFKADKNDVFITKRTVESTSADKCGLYEYIKSAKVVMPISYLRIYKKYPFIENLSKIGFGNFITSLISECSYTSGFYYNVQTCFDVNKVSSYINIKKARPCEMLCVSKTELKFLKNKTFSEFLIYQAVKEKFGICLDEETFKKIKAIGDYDVRRIIYTSCEQKLPFMHFLNYIIKQRNFVKDKSLITVQFLFDYWNSVKKLYAEVPSSMLWPKNLKAAHDDAVIRVKEKENEEVNALIIARAVKNEKYYFEDKESGLLIRPCRSHRELIEEGMNLSHCVARYANDYGSGKTNILFIRHIDSPDESYFTLEYKNGSVAQNRGKNNCARSLDVVIFEKKWLEHLKTLNKKRRKEKC